MNLFDFLFFTESSYKKKRNILTDEIEIFLHFFQSNQITFGAV